MPNFIDAFERICEEKGLNFVRVYESAGITKENYSKIKGKYIKNPDYTISRPLAIQLGLSLGLTLSEMQVLLSTAGYILSENILYDRFVMKAIFSRDFNVVNLNIAFDEEKERLKKKKEQAKMKIAEFKNLR